MEYKNYLKWWWFQEVSEDFKGNSESYISILGGFQAISRSFMGFAGASKDY